jgi:N-carbamoyl-L-amino-acid hydrolase
VAGPPTIDAARVIADLRELDRRTGGPEGARRLCWGDAWREGRAFCAELLTEIGLEPERDEAGNVWARLEGERGPALALGSHLDSVPDGGWLDGALGVMAALGVLRAWASAPRRPRRDLALVDWADEEGARFGRSLFGSSAFAGTLDPSELEGLRDVDGRGVAEVLAENGLDLAEVRKVSRRRSDIGAYLELHIEQGPVLEAEGRSVAAVSGCAGVERHRFTFRGQASHAGTTPMGSRRDAGLSAAATALEVERIASREGGVATTGALSLRPGIPTAVPGEAALTVDLRNPEAQALARMLEAVREAAGASATAWGCEIGEELVWHIEPIVFDEVLVDLALDATYDVGGRGEAMTSGALHDAAEVARVLPAAMLFCPSKAGISHAKEEDTDERDLKVGIETFGALAVRVLEGME